MAARAGKSQEMDPGIWGHLPVELLEHVLSFLPLKSFFNLLCTCKRFKSLIYSPSFLAKYSPSSSSSSSSSSSPALSSFLLLSHPQFYRHRLPLYDSAIGNWRNLSLTCSILLPYTATTAITLLSAANGLLCFSLPNSSSFLVCNLLVGSSRVLQFPGYPFAFEMLTLVPAPDGYKIFMIASGSSSNNAWVYDSGVHSWREFQGFDPTLSDNCHQGVYCNGVLYFCTSEPFSVVCFDLESGVWDRSVVELPGELTFVKLVSDGEGKLYLVGGIGRNGISKSMKLWELEGENWVLVESLPEFMCQKLVSVCYHNYEHVYCFWHQETICVCCYTWPEILYYKVARRTWHWLPKCPSLPDKWSCGFRWFSFVPELYAQV
ncbi:F-box/kelch-repeat protein [Vitis vinifera]|uniref:F-box/kelch-repeat protein n=1 Tax=Vitis vinifera TaxID=29760 RepID=A0A438KN99_VITVI|nr:F-box/kelch-repeat protein [Vitis vinifera]